MGDERADPQDWKSGDWFIRCCRVVLFLARISVPRGWQKKRRTDWGQLTSGKEPGMLFESLSGYSPSTFLSSLNSQAFADLQRQRGLIHRVDMQAGCTAF